MEVIEDFVPFKMAIKLKEKGLTLSKEYIFGAYDEDGDLFSMLEYNVNEEWCVFAPTISQALKWLRETKSINLEMCMIEDCWVCPIIDLSKKDEDCDSLAFCVECLKGGYKSYEEAAIAGVNYVLDNLI